MGLVDYRLLAQVSAGRDGVAYRAQPAAGGSLVELRRLHPDGDPSRRRRLRLAARVAHPNLRRVIELETDGDTPYVALEADDRPTLAVTFGARPAVPAPLALRVAQTVAGALTAAHRLGLAVGRIDPVSVRGGEPGSLRLDPTGLDVGAGREAAVGREGFIAPEARGGSVTPPSLEADVYALGALLAWLLRGEPPADPARPDVPASLLPLFRAVLHPDPTERPTAAEVSRMLDRLGAGASPRADVLTVDLSNEPVQPTLGGTGELDPARTVEIGGGRDDAATRGDLEPLVAATAAGTIEYVPTRLGRFRVSRRLGVGGMGEVYLAEDEVDGTPVALKVLRPDLLGNPGALRRFRKEARMLARVNNPYVTRLVEMNEDGGRHFLALEYVAGKSLDRVLEESGRLDEPTALAVAADVARGLMDAHRLGIVHRDVKPANILVPDGADRSRGPRVKLSDFGLARQESESESMVLTQAGAVVGTPAYMAPEQAAGTKADARADVYALGATLFHLLTGRPPFEADDWRAVVAKHRNEPPPPLSKHLPGASEALSRVVAKALAKTPDARYDDAEAFLDDLERIRRGEPTGLLEHPALPRPELAGQGQLYDFVWELDSPPERLWPYVANTDRLDRALGFGAVDYTLKFDPAVGMRRFLRGQKAGQVEEGEEQPYEWVEGRRLGVFREYSRGPFRWVLNVVELTPRGDGGTTLHHQLRLEPRGLVVRLGARWGVGNRLKRDLERVYRRIDATVAGRLAGGVAADPFEAPAELPPAQRQRLDALVGRLVALGLPEEVVTRVGDFVATAPAPELSRVRPLALARRLGLPDDAVVATCLHGAGVGLFVLTWDLLCPVCRVASAEVDTLRALADHAHCEACQLDYTLDFARSVELVFRSHPQVREPDTNLYCAAGPGHMPHVAAQVRVAPRERLDLELDLREGVYQVRGPQLPWRLGLQVRNGAPTRRHDLTLTTGPAGADAIELAAGGQVLVLDNPGDRPLVVRVERTAARDDALTAARASSLALFRELFPAEVLAPGRLVRVADVALLLTALDQPDRLYRELGDARAFETLHELFRRTADVVSQAKGALVKTVGEGVVAAFTDPDAAVAAALALPEALRVDGPTASLAGSLRAAIHSGPALAATLNDHLDYFGTTAHQAATLLDAADAGTLLLTEPVASDPRVADRIDDPSRRPRVVAGVAGLDVPVVALDLLPHTSSESDRARPPDVPAAGLAKVTEG